MTAQRQLRERASVLADLRQIVQAMKNLAMAELQRLQHSQPALAEARQALTEAWVCLDGADPAAVASGHGAPRCWLVIGAERGFCGAFNTHLAAAVQQVAAWPGQDLWLAGQRLADAWQAGAVGAVGAVGQAPRLLPGCAALDEAEPVLDAWLQAATDAATAQAGREVWLLATGAEGLQVQRLLPAPTVPQPWAQDGEAARWAAPPAVNPAAALPAPASPPRLGLPRPLLRAAVLHQAVRVQLRAALETSLVQENHARLAQMQRAQDHLDELSADLRRRWASLRQSDITNELEILTAALGTDDGR